MRTMYIILSWAGWGWFLIAMPTVIFALHRRRVRPSPPRGFPVVPIGTEAERRP